MTLLARQHRARLFWHQKPREPTLDAILDRTEELVAHQVLLSNLGWLVPRQRAAIVLR